jgi:hypothetical protein
VQADRRARAAGAHLQPHRRPGRRQRAGRGPEEARRRLQRGTLDSRGIHPALFQLRAGASNTIITRARRPRARRCSQTASGRAGAPA